MWMIDMLIDFDAIIILPYVYEAMFSGVASFQKMNRKTCRENPYHT